MSLPSIDLEAPINKDVEEATAEKNSMETAEVQMETDEQAAETNLKSETHYDADCEMNESAPEDISKKEPDTDNEKSTVLAVPIRSANDAKSRHNLKWNLRVIISNIYMNSEQRLPGARVPKCLHNTSLCVSKHRCSMLPDAPDISIAQELRNNLYNKHYETYLDMLETMALQYVYPDEAVFDRLFDMIMILTNKTLEIPELRSRYNNVIRIFYLLLDTFPPCWTALRPYYLDFLGVSSASEQKPQKLQIYLDLLEECLEQCSETELKEYTKYFEKFEHDYMEEDVANLSQESMFLRHVQDYDWQAGKDCIKEFKKMSTSVRLARVFDALAMLCWVLEREFLSWLDHNRMQQAEPDIFQDELKPFALIVFGMTPNTRLTKITRQLLRLYSRAAAKSLHPDRLAILQRFVSLIMEASNTAELQYAESSLIYPSLGTHTRRLIVEYFRLFKTENPTHISTYIKVIPKQNQRYVRFEFANLFLQLFYCSNEPFGPKKVCEELKAKQWLKYKPRSAIDQDDDEQLAREDYLKIMLNALRDYCLWLNIQPFWKYMKTKVPAQPLQTRTTSPLATPVGAVTGEVGKIFMLDEMQKEAHTWKQRINCKVIVSKPKVNLPVARISVSKMAELYGTEIRQLRYLRRVLQEVMRFVDVTEWLEYLGDLLGEDEPPAVASGESTSVESDK